MFNGSNKQGHKMEFYKYISEKYENSLEHKTVQDNFTVSVNNLFLNCLKNLLNYF